MSPRYRSERGSLPGLVENSLAMVTALAPLIGYDAAANIAHEAVASNRTVREVAQLKKVLTPEQLEKFWSLGA